MHSHHPGRWLAAGAAVLAVAIPVAASASASSPPTEPVGSEAPASDPTMAGSDAVGDTTAGSEAGSDACANVFSATPTGDSAAPTGDTVTAMPAGTDEMTAAPATAPAASDAGAATDVAATPDSAAAEVTADSGADTTAGGSEAAVAGPFVQTADTPLGTILVDDDCRALYAFTNDVDGESTCFDGCATAWPPLLVEGEDVPELGADLDPALFSVVEHPLGPMLKVGDFPLYYFASDAAPGDINGQGVNGVWFVVAPDGTLIESTGEAGDAPADTTGASTAEAAAAPTDSAPADSGTKSTDSEY